MLLFRRRTTKAFPYVHTTTTTEEASSTPAWQKRRNRNYFCTLMECPNGHIKQPIFSLLLSFLLPFSCYSATRNRIMRHIYCHISPRFALYSQLVLLHMFITSHLQFTAASELRGNGMNEKDLCYPLFIFLHLLCSGSRRKEFTSETATHKEGTHEWMEKGRELKAKSQKDQNT